MRHTKGGLHEACVAMCETLSKVSIEVARDAHSPGTLDGMVYELDVNITEMTECLEFAANATVADDCETWGSLLHEAQGSLTRLRENLIFKREQAQGLDERERMKDQIIDTYSNIIERVRVLQSLAPRLRGAILNGAG